jgi:hypothetical protein
LKNEIETTMRVLSLSIIAVSALAAFATFLAHSRNKWIQNVRTLESTLTTAVDERDTKDDDGRAVAHQTWEDLPPVVQRYLSGVFFSLAKYGDNRDADETKSESASSSSPFHSHSLPMIRSLRFR